MRIIRIVVSLALAAVLFAAGWTFYKWLYAQQDRWAQPPLREDQVRPANRPGP